MDCPTCGGAETGVLLGTLGKLAHFRCRNCGMTFHTEVDDGDESN